LQLYYEFGNFWINSVGRKLIEDSLRFIQSLMS